MEGKTAKHYHCVECGKDAPELYKVYDSGVIKMAHCDVCGRLVDKYVEFDSMVISLDAVLHKAPAYRHLLFNSQLESTTWKLPLIFMLCDTYLKWDNLGHHHSNHPTEDHIFYAAVEWQFYTMFAVVVAEWCIFYCASLLCFSVIRSVFGGKTIGRAALFCTLTVSSFGKLLAIPAIIWGQTHSASCLTLARVFVITSNVSAIRVLCEIGYVQAAVVIGFSHSMQYLAGHRLSSLITDHTVS